MTYFTALLISVFITVSLIPLMTRMATRFQIVDFPDPRKVHAHAVPRIGGLAMALGAFIPVIVWRTSDHFVTAFIVSTSVIVSFGLMDDIKGLGYKVKFTGQLLAALVMVLYGGVRINYLGTLLPDEAHLPVWFSVFLSVLAFVGVTNAINLSDGLDGLAGGISLLGFCCIGYLAYLAEDHAVIILSLSLAGAIFGFLRYNTYPASLFMGDTGSQLLGFSAVVLAVKITQSHLPFSPLLPLIILGFPVLDTLAVMTERIRSGRSPFSPDRNHFHHRLMRFGLSHAEAVFAIYIIQAALIVSALYFKYYSAGFLLAFYGIFSGIIICTFVLADRMKLQVKRYPLLDITVKGKLRRMRDNNILGKTSFALSKIVIPLPLLSVGFFADNVPGYASAASAFCMLLIVSCWIFVKKHIGFWLRFVLYMIVPLALYLVESDKAAWISPGFLNAYHLFFGVIAIMVLSAAKFMRGTRGFRMTPMDFLIIFIAVAIPRFIDQSALHYNLGILAVEMIVLLFSYEFLITELRGEFGCLTISTLTSLAVLCARDIGLPKIIN